MSDQTNLDVDGLDEADPLGMVDDDLPTLLRRREHARPNRVTWVLLALLLVSVGFIGGAYANERFGATTSDLPSGFPAALPGGFSGALPGAGYAGAGRCRILRGHDRRDRETGGQAERLRHHAGW